MLKCLRPLFISKYFRSNLLTSTQSGFPAGHSTQDLLLKVEEDWKNALDCDDLVDSIFIEGI